VQQGQQRSALRRVTRNQAFNLIELRARQLHAIGFSGNGPQAPGRDDTSRAHR
jgi:hypothetical protein